MDGLMEARGGGRPAGMDNQRACQQYNQAHITSHHSTSNNINDQSLIPQLINQSSKQGIMRVK